ncbi:hypothetical protein [Lysinibacillus sphaericus]|uniref:hypothetical protein n=1 Tax=Lysinibacillus TaxID=400634 RepID=UPI001CC117A5|nr:hypothetical protein [Lysinibacillus sphaericus]
MMGFTFLTDKLMEDFEHYLCHFQYNHVVRQGIRSQTCISKNYSKSEVEEIVKSFKNCEFPIVFTAGSKSTIKFWDYHIGLKYGNDKTEVYIHEMLVREPLIENCTRGITMASYILMNKKFGVKRMIVPFDLEELGDCGDFLMNSDSDQFTSIIDLD